MKIASINNFSMPVFQLAPQKNNNFYNKNNSLISDTFEKNNISFEGEKNKGFKLSGTDQLFIAAVSRNLMLKEDEQDILRQEVINFLKDRGYESLDDIKHDDETYPAMELAGNIERKLELDQIDTGMLMSDLEERLQSKEKYTPTNRKYQIDIQLLTPILEEYGFVGEDGCADIDVFAYMCKDASKNKFESLFDIFKNENNPIKSQTYKYLAQNAPSKDNLADLMIRLNYSTDMDTPQKRFEVSCKMFMDSRDNAVAADVANRYWIDVGEVLKIVKKLDDANVLPMQVAFEIADKYNLPSGSEDEILEMIKAYEADDPRNVNDEDED